MITANLLMRPTMAKKAAGNGERPNAGKLRRDYQSAAELRAASRALTEQATALDELAGMMDQQNYKRLHVDGVRKFPNALKLLREYVGNVKKSFIDEQMK